MSLPPQPILSYFDFEQAFEVRCKCIHWVLDPPTNSFRSHSFLARIGKLESLENNLLHWNPATTPVVWEALVRRLARVDVSLQFLQSIFVFKNDFLFSESGSRPSLLRYSWICPWSVSSHRSSTLSVGNNDRQTNGTMNGAVCQLLT